MSIREISILIAVVATTTVAAADSQTIGSVLGYFQSGASASTFDNANTGRCIMLLVMNSPGKSNSAL